MRLSFVSLAILAALMPAASYAQDLEASSGATISATSAELARASKMWTSGDHAGAVRIWQAMGDSRDAQYNLGQAYRLGRGVSSDLGMARVFYEKALERGHPKAAEQLGLLLFNETSTRASSVPFLEQAAANGSPRAEMALGIWYFEGADRPNVEMARTYLSRASAAKIPGADAALARLSLDTGAAAVAVAASPKDDDPVSIGNAASAVVLAAIEAERPVAVVGQPLRVASAAPIAAQPVRTVPIRSTTSEPVRIAVTMPPKNASVATMGLPMDRPVAVAVVNKPVVQAIPVPRPSAVQAIPRAPRVVTRVEASDEVMVYSSPSGNYSRKRRASDAAEAAPVVIWWN